MRAMMVMMTLVAVMAALVAAVVLYTTRSGGGGGGGVQEDFFSACLGPEGDLRYSGLGVRAVPRTVAAALPKLADKEGVRSPQLCADACARLPVSACGGFAWVDEKCALLGTGGPPSSWPEYAPQQAAGRRARRALAGAAAAFVGTRVPDYVDQRYAKVTNHLLVVAPSPEVGGGKKAPSGDIKSARACADACSLDPDCAAFMYDGKAGACWTFPAPFKDDLPAVVAPGIVSGQRSANAGDCGT